jgi:gamma-glutamyl-gamma-aminobutyrate hydrolase PuuD
MKVFKKNTLFVLLIITSFLSLSCSPFGKQEQLEIEALVIPSRNQTRMQPEIFYAFIATAKKTQPLLKITFTLFNPFQHEIIEEGARYKELLKEFQGLLEECVSEVVAIKKDNPATGQLLKDILDYIKIKPNSSLSKLYSKIETLMGDFEFLIIESSDTYGIHPMFYTAGVIQIDTPEGATESDLIETLYGLFFLDVALKQTKPVWGTCHGSQIGYVHAGGRLGRLFEYKEGGYDLDFKNIGQKDNEEEIWHLGKMLVTEQQGTDYFEYGMAACPAPDFFKNKEHHGKQMYMNKEFAHSFALVEPIPDNITVISYHPLSEYIKRGIGKEYDEFNKDFKKVLKDQVIVDAYKYKTMLGTQYHPHYTYDDLETSIVFEYLIEQIADRYKKNH